MKKIIFIFYLIFFFNLIYLNGFPKSILNDNLKSRTDTYRKKNLILGALANYSWETISPFFKSLIKANIQNYECVIFVKDISQIIINEIKNFGVFVFEIPDKYKKEKIINVRWKLYFDFLNDKIDKYNLIFAADVRDTIFQKDVFKFYENKGSFLGVPIEDVTQKEISNKKWIIDFVGKDLYETIQHERVICVGTIWGTIDKFMEFSNILYNKLSEYPEAVEQGVANYLFYHNKIFNNCLIKSDNFGPVMTIGLTNRCNILLDEQNNILNFDLEIAAVVHQYDRKPDLVDILKKKFCPELFLNYTLLKSNYSDKPKENDFESGINNFNKDNKTKIIKFKFEDEIYKNNKYNSFIFIIITFLFFLIAKIFLVLFQIKNKNNLK